MLGASFPACAFYMIKVNKEHCLWHDVERKLMICALALLRSRQSNRHDVFVAYFGFRVNSTSTVTMRYKLLTLRASRLGQIAGPARKGLFTIEAVGGVLVSSLDVVCCWQTFVLNVFKLFVVVVSLCLIS